MNKNFSTVSVIALFISLAACALKGHNLQSRPDSDCSMMRNGNNLYKDGKPFAEVLFLRRPNDDHIIGISIYDQSKGQELWIYPSQGWKLAGDCCIELAHGDATSLKAISKVWKGTVSAPPPLSGGCYDVHFTNDNCGLRFTTQSLFARNPNWEYSFIAGTTLKIGKVSKKN